MGAFIGRLSMSGKGGEFLMPFGEHCGKKLKDVPTVVVDFLFDAGWLPVKYPDLFNAIVDMRACNERDDFEEVAE